MEIYIDPYNATYMQVLLHFQITLFIFWFIE